MEFNSLLLNSIIENERKRITKNERIIHNESSFRDIVASIRQISMVVGMDPTTVESILSIVGKQICLSLQEKQTDEGSEKVHSLVNQYGGNSPNSEAVGSLFSPQIEQDVCQNAADRTGLDANIIKQILPSLVPLGLLFFQLVDNSLLDQIIADGGGDLSMGDVIRLLKRFFA